MITLFVRPGGQRAPDRAAAPARSGWRWRARQAARTAAWKDAPRSILRDLAAGDFPAHPRSQIERMIVPGFDLARGRVIGTNVASHAALAFRDELDGRDELGRFVTVAAGSIRRSGAPWRSASGFPAISSASMHARLEQIFDGEVLVPLVGAIEAHGFGGPQGLGRFQEWPKRKPPQLVRDDQHCTHFIRVFWTSWGRRRRSPTESECGFSTRPWIFNWYVAGSMARTGLYHIRRKPSSSGSSLGSRSLPLGLSALSLAAETAAAARNRRRFMGSLIVYHPLVWHGAPARRARDRFSPAGRTGAPGGSAPPDRRDSVAHCARTPARPRRICPAHRAARRVRSAIPKTGR